MTLKNMTDTDKILKILKEHSSEESRKGMARYGINVEKAFGTGIPLLREIAKQHRKDHALALDLWKTGFHEARILATMVDDPARVDEKQMESWVKDFNSWDICDQCIMNLFEDIPLSWTKIFKWCKSEEEFVKRAGFVLIARLGVSDKKAKDEAFLPFFPLLVEHSDDARSMVRKAVNWALRQIGKRNKALNAKAIELAEKIQKRNSKTAKWIAADALKELKSEAIQKRLK
jgi:3-methyladenine DNA glycosylase AlkD